MTLRRFAVMSPSAHDAIGLSLLSTALTAFVLWAVVCTQKLAQQPAGEGVMAFHLGRSGDLRLWNQPIRPQDVPVLLERAQARGNDAPPLVVRLIPDPQVPWGAIQSMLDRLRPTSAQKGWTLQLQLP